MNAAISVALPVFAVIAAGLLAGRLNIAPVADTGALNRFVFRFAMPAALFGLTARAKPLDASALAPAGAYAAAVGVVIAAAYFGAKSAFARMRPEEDAGRRAQTAGAHALASSLGNAVFLGLPIALAIPQWAETFVLLMLVEGVGVLAINTALVSPRDGSRLGPWLKAFRNPLVAAMLAGLAFSAVGARVGFTLDGPIAQFIDILGRAAGPTALISLGLFLSRGLGEHGRAPGPAIIAVAVAKMAALPVITFVLARAFGVDDPAVLGPLVLFTAMPSAVASFVIASQYDVYVKEAAVAVATTTALSVLSVSLALTLFAPPSL